MARRHCTVLGTILGCICTFLVITYIYPSSKPAPSLLTMKQTEITPGDRFSRLQPPDWKSIFSFVPSHVESCHDLFPETETLPPDFQDELSLFEAEVLQTLQETGESSENLNTRMLKEYLTFIELAKAPFVQTVCETGFNAGHTTLAWLHSNPRAQVYAFDIGQYSYSVRMGVYLTKRFSGRLNLIWGDSTLTLQDFRRQNPDFRCDLLIVNGGENSELAQANFNHLKMMANPDNIVIYENHPLIPEIGNTWEAAKRSGEVFEIFHCNDTEHHIGFSVGRYAL